MVMRAPGKPRHAVPAVPGPKKGVLPPPPPAGELPPEDSRLWKFIPKAVAAGEAWIQEDTRDWFEDHDRKVQVCRNYPTHPRWMVGAAANTSRGAMLNEGIISEIHMLVRLTAGMADVPAWIPARLAVKQVQADLAHRLTKTTRGVFLEKGKQAMHDFADRAPGQFIKFIAATFIPKQIEQEVTVRPGGTMDPETADAMIEAFAAELKRREEETARLKADPLEYEGGPVIDNLAAAADDMARAVGDHELGNARRMNTSAAARRLTHVVDLEADIIDPVTGEYEWD